jgi:hypothetical protein
VDVWAAGVILLSLLSRRHPVFCTPPSVTNPDKADLLALVQIAALLGPESLQATAKLCGKEILSMPAGMSLNTPRSLYDLIDPAFHDLGHAGPVSCASDSNASSRQQPAILQNGEYEGPQAAHIGSPNAVNSSGWAAVGLLEDLLCVSPPKESFCARSSPRAVSGPRPLLLLNIMT